MRRVSKPRRAGAAAMSADAGMALVLVLWIVLAVALQVSLMTRGLSGSLRIAANDATAARRELLVHAAVEATVARLRATDPRRRSPADGQSQALTLPSGQAMVRTWDVSGHINLNRAEAPLVASAFRAAGITDAVRAETLAARVLDWRDADSETRTRGAERADYRRAGRDSGPANLPFLHISELGRVLGVSSELAERVAAVATVYGNADKINILAAPDAVIRALPDIDAGMADRALAARTRGDQRALEAELSRAAAYFTSSRGPVYRLEIDIALDAALPSRTAVVILIGSDPSVPYHVLNWGADEPGTTPGPGRVR